ncbi:MAG: hypothetical protein GY714_29390 [Desulfobacterales bacterium]|nr:hypothetical protein [Desulfobacterales bacterium]MCP4159664.1 hypothetical protein [Deltaproteobacteria bacterium]
MSRKILIFIFISLFFYTANGETLKIVGTGSGVSILKKIGKEFTKKNPSIKIEVPHSIGSGGGIKSVGNEKDILGRVARNLNKGEKLYGLSTVKFARIPIVIFVNKSVKLNSITSKQFCDIYSGKIRRWEQINGGKGKIRVIKRENHDSSDNILKKFVNGYRDIVVTKRSKTTYSDPETIEECGKKINAIAYGAWPNVKIAKNIIALKLNGIHPTDKKYYSVGTLSLIFKEKNLAGSVKKFIEFTKTKKARRVIIKAGGLPVL